jgi:hypothetical protein
VNTRKVSTLIRELADADAQRARVMLALAEAFELEEAPVADTRPRRTRGKGSLLLPALAPVSELDQRRAAKALEEVAGMVPKRKIR